MPTGEALCWHRSEAGGLPQHDVGIARNLRSENQQANDQKSEFHNALPGESLPNI